MSKKVEVNIEIDTTPERVIEAFMDAQMLKEWWEVEKCLIQKKVGGIYTLAWNITESGMAFVSTGIIKNYDPAGELTITDFVYLNPDKPFLGPMSLWVKAIPNDSSSDVYLCQDGYQEGDDWDWYYQAVKEAWPKVMVSFKEYLEGISP
ncbi:SRPBCC domain-containing protein [Marinoscillum sp. MHG1-6]|uniref:SRPBCC domain-containing protein n=1 Tax=Marinoscillum sp. MHG1-6 TaxID=2959627 RepID=UPI002157ADE7|nr:SRPBCC domain-containing protein [Marinoscillum sp. MHG1-6]